MVDLIKVAGARHAAPATLGVLGVYSGQYATKFDPAFTYYISMLCSAAATIGFAVLCCTVVQTAFFGAKGDDA
tara:strand:+ start:2165 stop:2383 length:219 start_codon:yes stop_codon:yes gene_type:complete